MTIGGILRLLRNSPSAARALLRSRDGSTPEHWFAGLSDDSWFWINLVGRRRFEQIAAIVPGMPDATLQAAYTGNSEEATLREGFAAYQLFKRVYEAHVGELSAARVLDFGCGWGRIIRFFLREVPPDRLVGVDHSSEAIEACRATNRWCSFHLIRPEPPTSLAPCSFDLIYLYSVFSHLPEEMHLELLQEFYTLLAPGGLLVATTWSRDYILHCESLREKPPGAEEPLWIRGPAKRFQNTEASLAAYDRGDFVYEHYEWDDRWFWGEACIPKPYVERRWTSLFDLRDYIADPAICPQNVIVAQKPFAGR